MEFSFHHKMEEKQSTLQLVTELCSVLQKELIEQTPNKNKLMKQMTSQAFEVLLNKKNVSGMQPTEDDPTMLMCDIHGHVFFKESRSGEWTAERNAEVQELVDRAERLAHTDQTTLAVLKLLLSLADSALPVSLSQEPSFGLDMRTMISDKDLKHTPLLRGQPSFTSEIFNFPMLFTPPTSSLLCTSIFDLQPGTGLQFQQFFAMPSTEKCLASTDLEKCDVTNANFWICPELPSVGCEDTKASRTSRSTSVHQDEGYVTPGMDQEPAKIEKPQSEYIPWERMYLEDYKSVYNWENFGSARREKEKPFFSTSREAANHMWNVLNAYKITRSGETPVNLKVASLEELERALKSLLIGVESSFVHYSETHKSFVLQEGTHLQTVSAGTLQLFCEDFIQCGNCFLELSRKVQSADESVSTTHQSLIYKMLCGSIQRYLQVYQGVVLKMPALNSLLDTSDWVYRLRSHLQFMLKLLDQKGDLGELEDEPLEINGNLILTRLYNEVPLVTSRDISFLLYYVLHSCCSVYFRFVEKWIFEGECGKEDTDFFISLNEKQPKVEGGEYSRKFWTQMFVLRMGKVPGFLKGLEKDILVCGKSMALLKICAPEDPVCMRLKQGYPGVQLCLSSPQLQQLEEQCQLYSEEYQALCRQVFGVCVAEPPPDEDYYASLRAKAIEKINLVRAEENEIRAEKKRKIFNELKKNMEDAEARKIEDKRLLLEEEIHFRQEAEKFEQLNDLRREEEKEKLVQHYTIMSSIADKRKERAEWKTKRAQLYEKRVEFLKESQKLTDSNDVEETVKDSELKTKSVETVEEKVESLSSVAPGSGDVVTTTEKGEDIIDVSSQSLELTGSMAEESVHQKRKGVKSQILGPQEILGELNAEKREWMIALDIAEKARESAVRFKERDMFNDYNILTGEVKEYNKKFGKNLVVADKKVEVFPQLEQSSHIKPPENSGPNEEEVPCEVRVENIGVDNIFNDQSRIDSIQTASSEDFVSSNGPCILSDSFPQTTLQHGENECPTVKESSASNVRFETLKEAFSSSADLDVEEIDMTTMYQNLRMSVMKPLLTQLDLANEAVLRLMLNKHNLFKHIECIRRYFFFIDGEFGRNLTRSLFSEIQSVEHPSFVLNVSKLNSLLRSSAIGTSMEEEYTERLSFYVKEVPGVFRLIDPETLKCLSMRYKTYWPLNLVITDEAVIRCDQVFAFLLQLQRASWALEQDFYLLKDRRLVNSEHFKQVQLFRHIMTHFITSLKNYVTAVVLEQSWYIFKTDFHKAKTLNDVYTAHVKYVKMLNFRSLLNKRSKNVHAELKKLLCNVLTFHEVLRSGEWVQDQICGEFRHSSFAHLHHEMNSFLQRSKYLVLCIVRMANGYQPHLEQLLSLLCANDFYKSVESISSSQTLPK